jgi:hypothetical protein
MQRLVQPVLLLRLLLGAATGDAASAVAGGMAWVAVSWLLLHV